MVRLCVDFVSPMDRGQLWGKALVSNTIAVQPLEGEAVRERSTGLLLSPPHRGTLHFTSAKPVIPDHISNCKRGDVEKSTLNHRSDVETAVLLV